MDKNDIMTKIERGREYRNIDVQGIETREDADGQMIVEGYATTFNEPYVLYEDANWQIIEAVDARAFDNTDMTDVIMQYDHRGRVFARTKNNTLEITPDEHGLKVRADLGGTSEGRKLYEEIKGGYTDKMSFGFVVDGDERVAFEEEGREGVRRTITSIKKLYDVSAVSIPANDATEISARNLSDGLIAEVEQERLAKRKLELEIARAKLRARFLEER